MMRRLIHMISKEISGLHEAAYLLAGSAIVSLVFALVRDRLLAHILGPGMTLDIYYAAFRVPDFIFVTVASLVSTSILVPFLTESKEKGVEDLKKSIQSLFSSFGLIIILVSAVFYFLMPSIEKLLFPKFFAEGFGDTLIFTSRILLLSPILLGFASFFAAITQIHNRFLVYAIASPLYNVGIIFGIIVFLPFFGVQGLAMGVIIGALLLALTQIPLVIKDGLFPRITFGFHWHNIKRVALLAVPRTITLSSQQLTTLSLVSFASFLGAGSISIFNLAFNLQSVPLSIIGASYSSAAFPVLAKLLAQKEREAFLHKMIGAAQHIIFWSMPITVMFIVLRAQIVRTVLGSGAFSWSDTRLTAAALALFVISSVGQSLMLLFVRSFYAEGKTAKPLLINLISTVVTALLAYFLLKLFAASDLFAEFIRVLFKTEGADDSSVLMLPLAFTIGAILNLVLHWRSFSKEFSSFNKPVLMSGLHSLSASIIGGYVAFASLRFLDNIFDLTTVFGVFMQGLCAGIIGLLIIFLILRALKNQELHDIIATLKHKVWKIDRSSLDQLPS